VLVRTVDERRKNAAALLQAARKSAPGQEFTAAGQTLTRSITKTAEKVWADDSATGKRRDLGHEEDHAFWAWPSKSCASPAAESRNCSRSAITA
jgi:hypothetical protein